MNSIPGAGICFLGMNIPIKPFSLRETLTRRRGNDVVIEPSSVISTLPSRCTDVGILPMRRSNNTSF